jgi:YVTN family beta-propeller protein
MTRSFFAALVGSIAIVLGSAPSSAQNAYITNSGDNTVSVIDTATNTVVGSPIPVGSEPIGVAVTSDGSKVYVTTGGTVSVIDTRTNTVTATIPVGAEAVAVSSDGSKVYVTGGSAPFSTVSVIDTATNSVTATIPVPIEIPYGIAVSPDGSKVYATGRRGPLTVIDTATNTVIANIELTLYGAVGIAITLDGSKVYAAGVFPSGGNAVLVIDTATDTLVDLIQIPCGFCEFLGRGIAVTPSGRNIYVSDIERNQVWVIDTATNTVVGSPIPVGSAPFGVSVTPDGSKVYVANSGDNTVSVIDTATNMVVAVLPVGNAPIAFGVFIQPRFAGTPGDANCHGKSISALAQTFGGLNAAAIALGFPTVGGLQAAVNAFCGE